MTLMTNIYVKKNYQDLWNVTSVTLHTVMARRHVIAVLRSMTEQRKTLWWTSSTKAGFSPNTKVFVEPAVRTALSRPEVYCLPYWGHPFLTASTFVRIRYELHAWISWVHIKLGEWELLCGPQTLLYSFALWEHVYQAIGYRTTELGLSHQGTYAGSVSRIGDWGRYLSRRKRNYVVLKSDVWLTVHRNSVWIRKTN